MPKGQFKRTLKWRPGDVFAVPLSDRSFGYAQILAPVENFAIDFAILCRRTPVVELLSGPIPQLEVIAILATLRFAVTGGHWAKVGSTELCMPGNASRNQQIITSGEVYGIESLSIGLFEDFMSAYHGLLPWNMFPAFNFDTYLLAGTPRPATAKVLDQASLELYRDAGKPGATTH